MLSEIDEQHLVNQALGLRLKISQSSSNTQKSDQTPLLQSKWQTTKKMTREREKERAQKKRSQHGKFGISSEY